MWVSRKLSSIKHNKYNTTSKLTTKLDRINKPLPLINHDTPILTLVVIGGSNVGKSTFIRLGLQNLIPKHDSTRPDLQCHQTTVIVNNKQHSVEIIELNISDQPDILKKQNIPSIHGGLVCYDVTDNDSLECVPDLLNQFASLNIPTYLVGLKSDKANNHTNQLVQQLINLFQLNHSIVDAFSENGIQEMQDVYKALLMYDPPMYSFNDSMISVSLSRRLSENTGFIYAPTSHNRDDSPFLHDIISTTSGNKADSDNKHIQHHYDQTLFINHNTHQPLPSPTSPHSFTKQINEKRISSHSSHLTQVNSRRGSKDSCESFGMGLTVDDIIERLLSTEQNKTDENVIPIFLTFFRKFMKPSELINILIDRFDIEGFSAETSPTPLQRRIHSIYMLWLSDYWNDFHGSLARKKIILFLDRISKYDHLTPICDSLAPLIIREPPFEDADLLWGMVDSDTEDEDYCYRRNGKKDSAYASGTFNMSHFVVDQLQENIRSMSIPSDTHQLLIKRMSSTLSLNELTRSLSHSSSSSRLKDSPTAPNLASLSKGSHRVVTHSESQPDMYSSYIKKRSSHFTKHPKKSSCRVEFAGGLINIDNAIISRKYSISSAPKPPSMTSTVTGTGWASSILGPQLLASSIISSFRHHQSEKDQANYHYKYFMKTTDNMIADQLTWIESELFMRIKPREFIRNIWTTGIDQHGSDPNIGRNSNTVSASISHFNFISAWVVTMILAQTRLSKRVLVLQKFMSIAVELRNLNNYNSLMAVLAGINSASILRLKQTRHAIASKKIFKQFQSLERLMSTDKSFSSYRMALKASGAPGIPYLGIHTQDLVSLAEANKDFRADGTIHWDKFRLMGETIMATMKFKCPRYNIEPDIKLMRFIADTSVLSEDEQYKRSILIEPRLGSSSTNRIRDLLLRL